VGSGTRPTQKKKKKKKKKKFVSNDVTLLAAKVATLLQNHTWGESA
jgi:hypothetical protein